MSPDRVFGKGGTLQGTSPEDSSPEDADRLERDLQRELSHRINNIFAVVRSVVSLTAREHGNAEIAEAINHRIIGLAVAYATTLDHFSLDGTSLVRLVTAVLDGVQDGGPDGYDITGPDVSVDMGTLSVLGLILHEMGCASLKLAKAQEIAFAPRISWTLAEKADCCKLAIVWREPEGDVVGREPDRLFVPSSTVMKLLKTADGHFETEIRGGTVCYAFGMRVRTGTDRSDS